MQTVICKKKGFYPEDLSQRPHQSINIFKCDKLDQYINHPDNNYPPEELKDKLIEGNHKFQTSYPKAIPLLSSKDKIKCCKSQVVLKLHIPNRHTDPVDYYCHVVFLFFPFWKEDGSYLVIHWYRKSFWSSVSRNETDTVMSTFKMTLIT